MRPVTLLTQSFLLVTSVVAVPAILQPREDLATACASVTDLEADVSALSKELTSITSTDLLSDVASIVAELETLAKDLTSLGALLSCVALKTKRESLSSPVKLSALEQRQSLPDVCAAAKAVVAEIETVVGDVEALLPSLASALVADIEKILDALIAPLLPLLGC